MYYIIKIKDFYLEWSTIVDAPTAVFKSRERLKKWVMEGGRNTLSEAGFIQKMALVDKYGTDSGMSIYVDVAVKETLSCNRAGKNEAELTLDEIYRTYCLGERLEGWSPFDGLVGPIEDDDSVEDGPVQKLARGDEIPNLPKKSTTHWR